MIIEISNHLKDFIRYDSKEKRIQQTRKRLLESLTKNSSNAVYGGCIRKNIEDCYKCLIQNWVKNDYDDSVRVWSPLKNGNIIVKTKEKEDIDDVGISKKSILNHVI